MRTPWKPTLVLALLWALSTGMPPASAAPTATDPRWGLDVWTASSVPAAEKAIGVDTAIVGIYRDWVNHQDFPTSEATTIRGYGATPLIAWEPWDSYSGQETDARFTCAQIAAGGHDGLIERWARQARDYAAPVWIRLAPEQNGTWRPWSIGKSGNTASEYIAAWRHVVALFRKTGATNVKWVWNPYVDVGGSTPMAAGYPGNSYVDVIGLDGFNWGDTRPWGWQSYNDIFASSVSILRTVAPSKPWFIAETASAPGPKRAVWVRDTVASARRDGATAIVWFEFNKEADWRISTDPAARTALRQALAPSSRAQSTPPRAVASGSAVRLSSGKLRVRIASNAARVSVSYRTAGNAKRSTTVTIRRGAAARTLPAGTHAISIRAKANKNLRTGAKVPVRTPRPAHRH